MSASQVENDNLALKRYRNRLAQQRYRKRLKSRIEDLEQRAGGSRDPEAANYVAHQQNDTVYSSKDPEELRQFSSEANCTADDSSRNSLPYSAISPVSSALAVNASSLTLSDQHNAYFNMSSGHDVVHDRAGITHGALADFELLREFSLGEAVPGVRAKHTNGPDSRPTVGQSHAGQVNGNEPPSEYRCSQGLGISELGHHFRRTSQATLPLEGFNSQSNSESSSSHSLQIHPREMSSSRSQSETLNDGHIGHVLQAIEVAGYKSVDAFISHYYIAMLDPNTPAHPAQQISRCRGLPLLLEDLLMQSNSWPLWQSHDFKILIIKSAATLIGDEFDRLSRKSYAPEIEIRQDMLNLTQTTADMASVTDTSLDSQLKVGLGHLQPKAEELQRTLQNELPHLGAFATNLCPNESSQQRGRLISSTIAILNSSEQYPLEEAVLWILDRSG